jgi:SAM-dependent methyltransferase
VSDQGRGKTIEDVRRFWTDSPLFTGEGTTTPGTRAWFDEHESIYVQDCLAGVPPTIFTDGLIPATKILDVGCGPGFWVRYFARLGFSTVAACDLTQSAVDLTNRSLDLFGLKASVQVGNAEQLPYADASFDHVNCQGVVHHTPAPHKAVEEFARVLAPGGTACVSVYYRNILLRQPRLLRLVSAVLGRFVGLRGRGRESLLSSANADEIVRMYDGRENPIGRAYTESEFRQLLGTSFVIERVEWFYFPARALPVRIAPSAHRWLSRHFGLMIIAVGRKRHTG